MSAYQTMNWRQAPPSGTDMFGGHRGDIAVIEGRRIYMGNLDYDLGADEVRQFFHDAGFEDVAKVHINVDSMSNRNPGYCFIEFGTREEAERALVELPGGSLAGRGIKVGPCTPKRQDGGRQDGGGQGRFSSNDTGGNGSWGQFRQGRGGQDDGASRFGTQWRFSDRQQGTSGGGFASAGERERITRDPELQKRTVYVGALPLQHDLGAFEAEMKHVFQGFEVQSVSRPKNPNKSFQGYQDEAASNNSFCFVQLASEQDAAAAIEVLNGAPFQGSSLRVSYAKS